MNWLGDLPEDEIRALVYFSLVFSILSLVLVNRSFSHSLVTAFTRHNTILAVVLAVVAVVMAASLLWRPAAELFRFGPLHADDLMITVLCAATVLLVLEFLKPRFRPGPRRVSGRQP